MSASLPLSTSESTNEAASTGADMLGERDSSERDAHQQAAAEQRAQAFFYGAVEFLLSAPTIAALPPATLDEIAFVGRSNVGKSSLLNALTNRKHLARTSVTPGRTQALNYFSVAKPPRFYLVDMPGYGYAKAAQSDIRAWQRLIRAYLCGRATLKRVLLLVDSRHGLKESDLAMMSMLDEAAVTYQLVLTKADKIKATAQAQICDEIRAKIRKRPAAYPQVLLTSANKGHGIATLQATVLAAIEW